MYEKGEVAVIDTTGSFSPVRFRDVLVFRLEARSQRDSYQHFGDVYEQNQSKMGQTRDKQVEQATSMLDRVKVMRVFDFAGVIEAVGEVREMKERSSLDTKKSTGATIRERHEVCDSEEELDQDEFLPKTPGSDVGNTSVGTIGMIIVDTIANVVSSAMNKGQIHGQALLSSFMHSFQSFTIQHHICTIVINSVVGTSLSSNRQYQRQPEENVSIFSSTMGKPALGKNFAYLIDTSILMSVVPKTSQDATVAFTDGPDAPFTKALVLEVLKDRCGSREGRWAAFQIATGVKLVPC